jgi:hypothetical protein
VLVNLYKAKTPVAIFSLPLIIGLVCLSLFFKQPVEHIYFFKWQTDLFGLIQATDWLNFMLAGALISLNAHQLNNVFNRNNFYSKDTFLPGFVYVAGLVTFENIDFSPLLIAHLFLVGAMASFLQLKRQEPAKNLIFIGSVSIGIMIVFSPVLISLVFLPWLSLLIIKPFNWREWVVALLGLSLPVFYHYVINYLMTGTVHIEQMDVIIITPDVTWTILQSILYLTAATSILISLFRFAGVMRSQLVNFKKISQLTLAILALSALSFLIGWYFFNQFYIGFMLPLGYVISAHLLYNEKAVVSNILMTIWFITAMINLYL